MFLDAGRMISNDQHVSDDSGAGARHAPRHAVVFSDFVRPDQRPGAAIDCVEIPGPIRKIYGPSIHRWGRTHIALRSKHPLLHQRLRV